MDDGASGMWAIKRSGGTCVVQDPNEAEYPDMPLSVLNKMEVDFCVSVAQMGGVLQKVLENKVVTHPVVPDEVKAEAEIAEKVATGIHTVTEIGVPSVYTCPDCGGVLSEIKEENAVRFRCYTGHSYTVSDLLFNQEHNIESTLWVALRMMEERKNLLQKMEVQTRDRGFHRFARDHQQKAEDLQLHIEKLKHLLTIVQKDEEE